MRLFTPPDGCGSMMKSGNSQSIPQIDTPKRNDPGASCAGVVPFTVLQAFPSRGRCHEVTDEVERPHTAVMQAGKYPTSSAKIE